MKKHARHAQRRSRRASPLVRAVKWTIFLGLAGLLVYGLSQTVGPAWDEEDIRVVDFSSLEPGARRAALQRANSTRCSCGCGMNLAQCVATDMTCPIRDRNIDAIRTMVREAGAS